MAISEKDLEQQLLEAGNKLLSPPSSVSELLDSLDRVENLLGGVEQSPSESMKEALAPSTKALIAENLLRHSDVDVKVAVASCISEITRITAPDAPYEDEQMKEVFQLIVSSFEKLDEISSRSYMKRTSILETVAKVRSCVVMLDLECDKLIVEMFQHFLKSIRDDLNENVLNSMETIMTLVVEESEDISPELLSPILDVLKKENKELPLVARQLGETVFTKCASKIKPYLLPAVRSVGASLDDFVKAVADVYQEGNEAVEVNNGDSANKNLVDENELVKAPLEKPVEVGMETLKDAPPSEETGPSAVGSPKSNGTLQKETDDTSGGNDNSKDAGHDTQDEKPEPRNTNTESVDNEEAKKVQTKSGRSNRRKGRKPHSTKSSEPSEVTLLDSRQEAVKTRDHQESNADEVDNVDSQDPVADAAEPVETEKASEAAVSPSKTSDNEIVSVPSPAPSGSHADETRSKKVGRGKKNKDQSQDGELGNEDSKKESDGKKASERDFGQEESEPGSADEMQEDNNVDEFDGESAKELEEKNEVEGSRRGDKKKRGQAKATPGKGQAKTPSKDEKKKSAGLPKSTSKSATRDEGDVEEAPKSSSKRKRSAEEKASKTKGCGAELVGSKVRVWWPADKKYYKGVVETFDSVKKTHKVSYDDGDVEVLNLDKEKWMIVGPPPTGQKSEDESPDESADEMLKGKKTKISADLGAKDGKSATKSKKSGASSSKSKASPKTVFKQKDDGKKSSSKEDTLSKSVADEGGKSLKSSKSGSKISEDTPKPVKKSKDEAAEILKGSSKSKVDASKSAGKSKSKSAKSSGKSTPNTSVKVKASPSTVEESEDESLDQEQTPEKSKGKSQSSSKSQKNSKRKRSVKG